MPRRSSARGSRRGAGGIALIEPPELFHRVVAWPDPFDSPPTAPPIGSGSRDLGSRYDAPDASWPTLYTAAGREGAFGEKLAYFRTSHLEQKISEFVDGDPDEPEPPAVAELSAEDVEDWTFGTAEANRNVWLIDVMHPETHAACWPALEQLLAAFGHARMDNGATLGPNRLLTRQIAGHLHKLGVATVAEGVPIAGLRFESSLWSEWECFALWEPLELAPIDVAQVAIDDDDLVSAAAKLRVKLA